jgi:hypothetical protein
MCASDGESRPCTSHNSRCWSDSLRDAPGPRDCSGVLTVASLEGAQGLLSRFDSVYLGYITQGCPGGALAVAMSLRARCAFFPTHVQFGVILIAQFMY